MFLLVGWKSSWNEIGEVENVYAKDENSNPLCREWIFYFDGKNRMYRHFKDKKFSRLQLLNNETTLKQTYIYTHKRIFQQNES